MNAFHKITLLAVTGSFLIGGCVVRQQNAKVCAIDPAVHKPIGARDDLGRVTINDPILDGWVGVEYVSVGETPAGTGQIGVALRSCSSKPMVVQARTVFTDGGSHREIPTAWTNVFLSPGSIGLYSGQSTRRGTPGDFLVELRSEQ